MSAGDTSQQLLVQLCVHYRIMDQLDQADRRPTDEEFKIEVMDAVVKCHVLGRGAMCMGWLQIHAGWYCNTPFSAFTLICDVVDCCGGHDQVMHELLRALKCGTLQFQWRAARTLRDLAVKDQDAPVDFMATRIVSECCSLLLQVIQAGWAEVPVGEFAPEGQGITEKGRQVIPFSL